MKNVICNTQAISHIYDTKAIWKMRDNMGPYKCGKITVSLAGAKRSTCGKTREPKTLDTHNATQAQLIFSVDEAHFACVPLRTISQHLQKKSKFPGS